MWTDDPDDRPTPSKTQRKRESAARQALGEVLLGLRPEQLAQLDLPGEVLEAVRAGQAISARPALRRQCKFIGKLLRGLDTEPLRRRLAAAGPAEDSRLVRSVERWRDRMLAQGDSAVNEFLADYPGADRQKLRQLTRDARRERDSGQPPRAARLLFRYLRELLETDPGDGKPSR
ncbi:ribosome biogenesis factor YjgA [Candidatus Methylocalor cossyra]|uniref:Dual-action ribosomal maturation protein DarP n=1 Tax=Candidatus Methylocalor cossyra TaxID=3108543 RepID=A0ABP1C9E6_9GAMM